MKRLLLTTISLVLTVLGFAQVTATGGSTPAQYVNNVLLGNGVTASNVTYTGYANGIGKFTASAGSSLGFSTGLYLTTGSILQNDPDGAGVNTDGPMGPASGEQNVQQSSPAVNDYDLHAELAALGYDTSFGGMLGLTNDLAVLEFDFVPTSDTISFRYRFASEEYNDYVSEISSAGYNDIFAFLLRGVSPAAAAQYPNYRNIALIPNSVVPVSIFTVNNGYSPYNFASDGPCVNCAYYVDNVNTDVDVIYDGLTTILTAKAPVICGQTYHIKLAIADVVDQALDSGVFIEGGSFSSAGGMQVATSVNFGPNDSTLLENCNQGTVTLTRSGVVSAPQSIQVFYGGTTNTTSDFGGLPTTVSFSAGQATSSFNIQALTDALTEGSETLIMGFIVPSACGNTFDTIFARLRVLDVPALDVNAGNDIIVCNAGAIDGTITPQVTGGTGTLSYTWNMGATTPTLHVTAEGDYIITVTDQCSQTAKDTVTSAVVVPVPLGVSLPADLSLCTGVSVSIQATVTGGNGNLTYAWSNGGTGNPVQLAPQTGSNLTVTVTDACGLTATDNISLSVSGVDAAFGYSIAGMGNVSFTDQSSPAGLDHQWDFGDNTGSTDTDPDHTYGATGSYAVTLTVSNADGCKDATTQIIEYRTPTEVFIPNTFTPNSDGTNDSWLVSISYIEKYTLYVYDRWGSLVFSTDDLFNRWKGTYWNGDKVLKNDRYAYRILYTEYSGKTKELLGSVNLIR